MSGFTSSIRNSHRCHCAFVICYARASHLQSYSTYNKKSRRHLNPIGAAKEQRNLYVKIKPKSFEFHTMNDWFVAAFDLVRCRFVLLHSFCFHLNASFLFWIQQSCRRIIHIHTYLLFSHWFGLRWSTWTYQLKAETNKKNDAKQNDNKRAAKQ